MTEDLIVLHKLFLSKQNVSICLLTPDRTPMMEQRNNTSQIYTEEVNELIGLPGVWARVN